MSVQLTVPKKDVEEIKRTESAKEVRRRNLSNELTDHSHGSIIRQALRRRPRTMGADSHRLLPLNASVHYKVSQNVAGQDGRTSVNLQIRPIERRNGTSVSIRTHGNRGGQVVTRNYLSGCTDIGSHTVMSQLRDGDRWSEKYNSQMMRPAVRRPQTPMEPRPQPIRTATWSMLDLRDPKETFLLLPDPRVNRNSQLLWSTPYTSSSSRPVPSSSAIQANSMRPPLSKTKSVSLIPRPQACWKTSQQMVSGLTPKFRTSSAIDLSKSYGEEKPPRAVSSKIFTYVPKPTEEIARNDRNSRLTSAKEQNQLPLNKSNRGVQRITIIREREQNDRSVADPISYDMDSIDEETSPMWVLPKHFSSLSLEPLSEVLEDGVTETAVRPLPLPQAKSNYPRPRNGKCTYSSEFSPSAGSVTSIKPIVYRPPVCLENYQARGIDLRPTDSANYGWSRKGDQYRSTPNMLNFESFSPATFPRPLVYRPHQAGANSTNFSDQIGFYSSPNGIKFNGTVGNATDEDEEADEESEIEIDDADGGDNATHPTYIPVPTKRHSVSKNVTSSYSTNYSYPRVTDEESEMSSDFTGHYPDPRQSSNQGKMYTLPPKLSAPAFTNGLTAYNGVQRRPQNRKSISIGRPYHSDLRRQSFNYPPPDREYNKRWSVQIPFGTMKDIFSQPARERRKSVVSPAYQEGNQSDFSDLRTEFKGGTDGTEPNSFYDGYQSRLPYEHLPEALRKTVIAEKFRRPLSFCESAASGDVSTKHRSSEDRRRSISKANSFGLYQSPLVPSKQRAFSDWDVTKLNWVHSPENLHPDSYILSRPNVRRGFGGNYSRPNTGISMDRTQRFFTDSPIEQHRPILYNRSETSSSAASSDERRCNSVRGPRGRSNQKSPEVCTAYNQTSAMNGVVKRPFSQSCLPPACLSTPTFGWRCKTEREKQSDGKLLSLIEQLPPDRQSTVGFILLLMGIRQNDEKPTAQTVGGLEARLREALQLVSPEVASADKEVGIRADECPSTEGTKDGVLTPNHKSVSNGKPTNGMENNGSGESAMEDHSADLEMMTSQELKMDVENGMISTESNGEMATSDHNKPVLSNGSAESTKPGVATVLRRLARCMAIRLAYKRHHLANAQQKVAKNATEEKMLRNKLVGLISEVHHHGSLSNVRTTIDESQDTSTSLTDALTNNTLVTRFDRWHKNMASVIQLLCQLARRLAYVDARLRYVNDHRSGTDREQWRFPVDELDGETSESIKHQQEQLLTQIQEAQALRASFEKCRIRILEGIPGDLKVSAVTSSGPQSGKVGPLVQNGLPPADTKSLPNGNDNAAPTAGVNDQSPYLRDRVVIHLLSTVYWLLMYHMLDTQIRVDQELWDDIQDELRIEVSY